MRGLGEISLLCSLLIGFYKTYLTLEPLGVFCIIAGKLQLNWFLDQ